MKPQTASQINDGPRNLFNALCKESADLDRLKSDNIKLKAALKEGLGVAKWAQDVCTVYGLTDSGFYHKVTDWMREAEKFL